MRNLLARLTLAGMVGSALAGCGGGTASSVGGSPNSGGGGANVSSGGPPSATLLSTPPFLLDCGNVANGTYIGFNGSIAADAQGATQAPQDTTPKNAPANPAAAGSGCAGGDPGSHAITFAGNSKEAMLFRYTSTLPSLVNPIGTSIPGATVPATMGALVLHVAYTPAATSAGTITAFAIELVGSLGTAATLYDERITCSALPGSSFTRTVCPLPAYGAASNGSSFTNSVYPAATGTFTPTGSITLYLVVTFKTDTPPASTGNVLGVDYVYAEPGSS
jgi:hypothetical protein